MPRKKKDTTAKKNPATRTAAEDKKIAAGKPGGEKAAGKPTKKEADGENRIFALDIGTRSVIGIVADVDETGEMSIIATTRQEHKTRAMLDGQIHDVPQVASVINSVKKTLVKMTGPIKSAAVAAAGRALYTMTAEAQTEVSGVITENEERSLDFAGVQAAQAKLASSHTIDDPTRYYCVGYSTIQYILDDIPLKSLVGQRGKTAKARVIATFLPRQVIDSMQSALSAAKLDMRALTLEPIAAINVLIPPTMRHLNLVLVDIGAGTSDVAITKNGSVIAYGMVPLAGDEITEAISQKFLLDFNVAEDIKRRAAGGEGASFSDILGASYDLTAKEIIEPIMPNVKSLAEAIAKQITELNGETPQAVMLVGGGALTPELNKFVANALNMPLNRVAVRRPDQVNGIESIPPELQSPDAVTPLGILKIASINTLHFLTVYVNDEEHSLFNFRELTVSDALLNAGIQLRKYNGHPGLGLMITVEGEKKFFPGTLGTLAEITIDGEPAKLDTPVKNDSRIKIVPGKNGETPKVTLKDVTGEATGYNLYINGEETLIARRLFVNNEPADAETVLNDGDIVTAREPKTLGEALKAAGLSPTGKRLHYTLNGRQVHYSLAPEILIDDEPANISQTVGEGDRIEYILSDEPKLGKILNIKESEAFVVIYYNEKECRVPNAGVELIMNGRPASPGTIITEGADIRYKKSERTATTVSDALLAVNFQPPAATSRMKFTLLVNKHPAEFTDPVKNGDTLDVILEPIDRQPFASRTVEKNRPTAESTIKPSADKEPVINAAPPETKTAPPTETKPPETKAAETKTDEAPPPMNNINATLGITNAAASAAVNNVVQNVANTVNATPTAAESTVAVNDNAAAEKSDANEPSPSPDETKPKTEPERNTKHGTVLAADETKNDIASSIAAIPTPTRSINNAPRGFSRWTNGNQRPLPNIPGLSEAIEAANAPSPSPATTAPAAGETGAETTASKPPSIGNFIRNSFSANETKDKPKKPSIADFIRHD